MTFHPFARLEELVPGAFGISEPSPDRPSVDPAEIDVFLCPGLGFSLEGVRLGRGKGYYDRTLARSKPGSLRVGVAFREQILPLIPAEPHDLPMHRLVSSDGWIDPH